MAAPFRQLTKVGTLKMVCFTYDVTVQGGIGGTVTPVNYTLQPGVMIYGAANFIRVPFAGAGVISLRLNAVGFPVPDLCNIAVGSVDFFDVQSLVTTAPAALQFSINLGGNFTAGRVDLLYLLFETR